jgi:hypothetical protein
MVNFTKDFLLAVNRWQAGTNPDRTKQLARGEELKLLALDVDERFRRASLMCFRQITLGDDLHLADGISAWTMSTEVAKEFKGGPPVPIARLQSVIFEHFPKPEEVVLNLHLLHQDEEFHAACARHRLDIPNFAGGIGRYGRDQAEIILDVRRLDLDATYAFGGHSSSRAEIARMFFGHPPTEGEMEYFDDLISAGGSRLGPNWVTDGAMRYIKMRMLQTVEVLKPYKQNSSDSAP